MRLPAEKQVGTMSGGGGQQRQRLRLLSAELPDELIEEVIVRLPGKWLLGFKRVCKAWHSLISTPAFVQRHAKLTNHHHHHHQQQDADLDRARLVLNDHRGDFKSCSLRSIIDYNFDGDVPILETPPLPRPHYGSFLIGSCNGLLCAHFFAGNCHRMVVAWNPITKVYRKLPLPDFWADLSRGGSPPKTCGFGYDESTDDYKLVIISGHSPLAGVFSFKEDSWRRLLLPLSIQSYLSQEPGAFFGGALNWCARLFEPPKLSTYGYWAIVSFDLATETFRAFRLPRKISTCFGSPERKVCPTAAVLQGRLCLFVYNAPSDVWVVKDYGVALSSAWTLVATLPYISPPDPKIRMPRPVCLFKDEVALLVGGDQTIPFDGFDLRRKSLSYPWILGVNPHKPHPTASQAIIHLDTLVSPYGNATPADVSGNGIAATGDRS